MQMTRPVGKGNLTALSRQRTRPFFAPDSDFFVPNTTFLWFVRLHTLLIWLLAIFGCSPNWKRHWKGPSLIHEKILCRTQWPSCALFQRSLHEICPTMAGPLGEVCAVQILIWREFGFHTSRWVTVFFCWILLVCVHVCEWHLTDRDQDLVLDTELQTLKYKQEHDYSEITNSNGNIACILKI